MLCNGYSYWIIDFFWTTNEVKELSFEGEFLDSMVGFVTSVDTALVIECNRAECWSAVVLAINR
jgi:hypothetical protein